MGIIYKNLEIVGTKGKKKMNILFDTGASRNFVREDIALSIAKPTEIPQTKIELGKGITEVKEMIGAVIKINGYSLLTNFVIIPKLTEEAVLGAEFFQQWKIKLDPETEDIIIDPKYLQMKLI